jgi:hypothetical protein
MRHPESSEGQQQQERSNDKWLEQLPALLGRATVNVMWNERERGRRKEGEALRKNISVCYLLSQVEPIAGEPSSRYPHNHICTRLDTCIPLKCIEGKGAGGGGHIQATIKNRGAAFVMRSDAL